VNTSSTFMASAAPIRAKLDTINPLSARSRRPAIVVTSILSMRARASSGANTGVLPTFTSRARATTTIRRTGMFRPPLRFPITRSVQGYRFIIGPMEGTLLPRLNMHDAKALSYWV
jgi:hypothetical protein